MEGRKQAFFGNLSEIKGWIFKKKCKKAKWLSGEALQIAEKRGDVKGKEKRKGIPI